MIDSIYIAWKYVAFNKIKTAILITCITLVAFLPIALQALLQDSERQLRARAITTPLLVGAKGSTLDLVMNSLYFDDEVPELISMDAVQQLAGTNLAVPIPLYIRFYTRGFPIVGTTLDYFDFRKLMILEGRMLAVLGECVIGVEVAEGLGLAVGDSLVSSPETLFDISGIYPLKMRVVGILARSHSADDLGVFVDVKTTWVIQGLGHGHEDLSKTQDRSVILNQNKQTVTANAKLLHYTEITHKNLDSFHFHGDTGVYPITAVMAVPHDHKSATLLRGRYLNNVHYQIIKPAGVIDGLMANIFRIKNVIDAVIVIVGFTTALAIILVFILSIRLRQAEINTIFKLGCSRLTIAKLLAAEIGIITLVSGILCALFLALMNQYSSDIVRMFLFR